jgi:hypothetical protein
MMMRRAPKQDGPSRRINRPTPHQAKADKKPSLDTFIQNGDFTGAIALLEFERRAGNETPMTLPWLGYAAFHLGDYNKALHAYEVSTRPHAAACARLLRVRCGGGCWGTLLCSALPRRAAQCRRGACTHCVLLCPLRVPLVSVRRRSC